MPMLSRTSLMNPSMCSSARVPISASCRFCKATSLFSDSSCACFSLQRSVLNSRSGDLFTQVTERVRITLRAKEKMNQIGMQLLRESKAAAIASDQKDVLDRRDLLSLLTRANMEKEPPESQRLSDEDVLARE